MDIVKKNLVSIICGVLALAALVAVFIWPLDGYFEELQDKVKKRAALQSEINGLLTKQRVPPTFDPNNPNPNAERLKSFPSARVIEAGNKAVEGVQKQSKTVYLYAVGLNEKGHEKLAVAGSLPAPSNTIALNYRRNYEAELKRLRDVELKAGTPPTADEVTKRKEAIITKLEKDYIVVDGQITNKEVVESRIKEQLAKVIPDMQREMATSYQMYLDPNVVLRVPQTIPTGGQIPDPVSIWWAQLEFWITSDVVKTIKDVNSGSKSVLTSPVKSIRLLDVPHNFFPPINVTGGVRPGGLGGGLGGGGVEGGGAEGGGEGAGEQAPLSLADAIVQPLPENPATPTKRTGNAVFDVVHFTMIIDIEADKLPLFIKTLTANRFLSVKRVEWVAVDSLLMQANGYVFGPKPVITATLECEAVFMRGWTTRYMPKDIKTALKIVEQPAGQTARVGG